MKLTPTETNILEDRLAMWDCLLDVATDDIENENWTEEDMWDVSNKLCSLLPYLPGAVRWDSLESFCLRESVEGSTFMSRLEDMHADGECSKATLDRHYDAYRTLGEKIAKICGVEKVQMPWEYVPIEIE